MTNSKYYVYLRSPWWKAIRFASLIRAGRKCALCASKYRLEVHHNTYVRLGREKLSDLVVLCRQCHRKYHGIK